MSVALLLAVLATGDLAASPRTPALFLALADEPSKAGLEAAFSVALRARTDLELVAAADPKKLAACESRVRFSCWTRASDAKAAYLFVVAAQVDRAQVMMIDLSLSRAVLSSAGGEAAENRIFEEALTMSNGSVALNDPVALEHWAIELLERDMKPRLDRARHWEVFGEILVHAPRPGLSISLNGAKLGPSAEGPTRIRDVQNGAHVVAIDELKLTKNVDVASRSITEVTFELPRGASPLRTATLWTGVAIAAAGVAIEVATLASDGGSTALNVCRGADCAPDAEKRFDRAGPFLAAPLGYALFGTGGTWAGGALLSAEEETPWIALIAGGAVGVLAYGLSAALEGSRQ